MGGLKLPRVFQVPILPLLRQVINFDLCEIEGWLWRHCCRELLSFVAVGKCLLTDDLARFERCLKMYLNAINGEGKQQITWKRLISAWWKANAGIESARKTRLHSFNTAEKS